MDRHIFVMFCGLLVALCEGRGYEVSKELLYKRENKIDICKIDTPLWTCANKECILASWYCDGGEDCEDESDEADCADNVCDTRTSFPCGDGTCRPLSYRCDGSVDCPSGADEEDCPASMDLECADGTVMVGGRAGRCDSWPDCADGSDEANCEDYTCDSAIQLTCSADQSCRPIYYSCDGEKDCPDAEDEQGCPDYY